MAVFHYSYLNVKGKKQSGFLEALSEQEAKEKLRRQGILVLSLSCDEKKGSIWSKQKIRALSGKDLLIFTTQLSQLLKAGIPLYESLLSLEEQYRLEKFHPVILSITEKIKTGSSLSSAMAQFPTSFNSLYCAMIEAGESVGALDKTLEKLATLFSKQTLFRKQITTALLYPLLLVSFSFAVIFLLLTFVIPSLEAIFEDRNVNRFTSIVISCSHFLTGWWHLYLPLACLSTFFFFFFFRSPSGKKWLHSRLVKLPLLKTIVVQAALARFSRTMGTLLQGGVTILQAMQISRRVMRNPLLEEVIENAEKRIVEGSLLSIELRKSSLIPSLVPRMLAIGEEGGNNALMLQKIAEIYEEETEKISARLTALAQPVILIIMGGIVGIIMLAVLLPLTDVNAFLQG